VRVNGLVVELLPVVVADPYGSGVGTRPRHQLRLYLRKLGVLGFGYMVDREEGGALF